MRAIAWICGRIPRWTFLRFWEEKIGNLPVRVQWVCRGMLYISIPPLALIGLFLAVPFPPKWLWVARELGSLLGL